MPLWRQLAMTLYMLIGLGQDQPAVVQDLGVDPVSYPYPCHDDHPLTSFW